MNRPDFRLLYGLTLLVNFAAVVQADEATRFEQRELVVTRREPNVSLGGTLTVPNGQGPFPAVILLTVAGPNNRDQAFADHAGFKTLAEHLSTHGIAVARFDDRGVGESTGEYFGTSWEEFAADALAMLEHLKSKPRIDRDRIGFAGMSQGGAIGALTAAASDDVAFLILMSAPGLSGQATLQLQLEKTLELSGIKGEMADKYREMSSNFFEIISGDPQLAETRDSLREFFSGPGGALVPPYQFVPKDIDGRIEMFLGPWYRSNVLFDPQKTYGSLGVPTLIIGGLFDPVAPPESHVANIVAILATSSKAPITARLLPGVNHLMQDAKTGLPTEYAALDNSISPVVLEIIKDWIQKQR